MPSAYARQLRRDERNPGLDDLIPSGFAGIGFEVVDMAEAFGERAGVRGNGAYTGHVRCRRLIANMAQLPRTLRLQNGLAALPFDLISG